jgi:hypothetical protein
MEIKKMNRKANESLMNQIIFVIIILAFAVIMIIFVVRFGSQAAMKEELYAKQIALAIDKARTGTGIVMDVSDIYKIAGEKQLTGDKIIIDNNNRKVTVRLDVGKGYSFGFFSNNSIAWNIDDKVKGEEKLIFNSG